MGFSSWVSPPSWSLSPIGEQVLEDLALQGKGLAALDSGMLAALPGAKPFGARFFNRSWDPGALSLEKDWGLARVQ